MPQFRAIELERSSRKPTGRRHELDAPTRDLAIAVLLERLGVSPETARIDPTRTLLDLGTSLWTIVSVAPTSVNESAGLRRAGAKHRRVP
ncbi:MAG: hypothetical protein JOZ81_25845 [Chloroflexi bacterium]|nr:hypothetical protein [Chloroflexota bacterium]